MAMLPLAPSPTSQSPSSVMDPPPFPSLASLPIQTVPPDTTGSNASLEAITAGSTKPMLNQSTVDPSGDALAIGLGMSAVAVVVVVVAFWLILARRNRHRREHAKLHSIQIVMQQEDPPRTPERDVLSTARRIGTPDRNLSVLTPSDASYCSPGRVSSPQFKWLTAALAETSLEDSDLAVDPLTPWEIKQHKRTLAMAELSIRKDWEWKLESIEFHDLLGRGSFGLVFSVECEGIPLAAKKRDTGKASRSARKMLRSEIDEMLLCELRELGDIPVHANVLPLLGVIVDHPDYVCLLSELADRGNLRELLDRDRRRETGQRKVNVRSQLELARDIVNAMAFLHENGILHRDLKTANVLLFSADGQREGQLTAKVADVGLCGAADSSSVDARRRVWGTGTLEYKAPEALRDGISSPTDCSYGPSSEVYSFSIVLWEIVTSQHAWTSDGEGRPYTDASIITAVLRGDRPPMPKKIGANNRASSFDRRQISNATKATAPTAALVRPVAEQVNGMQDHGRERAATAPAVTFSSGNALAASEPHAEAGDARIRSQMESSTDTPARLSQPVLGDPICNSASLHPPGHICTRVLRLQRASNDHPQSSATSLAIQNSEGGVDEPNEASASELSAAPSTSVNEWHCSGPDRAAASDILQHPQEQQVENVQATYRPMLARQSSCGPTSTLAPTLSFSRKRMPTMPDQHLTLVLYGMIRTAWHASAKRRPTFEQLSVQLHAAMEELQRSQLHAAAVQAGLTPAAAPAAATARSYCAPAAAATARSCGALTPSAPQNYCASAAAAVRAPCASAEKSTRGSAFGSQAPAPATARPISSSPIATLERIRQTRAQETRLQELLLPVELQDDRLRTTKDDAVVQAAERSTPIDSQPKPSEPVVKLARRERSISTEVTQIDVKHTESSASGLTHSHSASCLQKTSRRVSYDAGSEEEKQKQAKRLSARSVSFGNNVSLTSKTLEVDENLMRRLSWNRRGEFHD